MAAIDRTGHGPPAPGTGGRTRSAQATPYELAAQHVESDQYWWATTSTRRPSGTFFDPDLQPSEEVESATENSLTQKLRGAGPPGTSATCPADPTARQRAVRRKASTTVCSTVLPAASSALARMLTVPVVAARRGAW